MRDCDWSGVFVQRELLLRELFFGGSCGPRIGCGDEIWLADRCTQAIPELPLGVDSSGTHDDDWDREVDVVCVGEANSDAGVSSEGSMDGVVGEDLAVDAVGWGGRNGTDHVRWVDVFDVCISKVLAHFFLEKFADVFENGIATGVLSFGTSTAIGSLEQFLETWVWGSCRGYSL